MKAFMTAPRMVLCIPLAFVGLLYIIGLPVHLDLPAAHMPVYAWTWFLGAGVVLLAAAAAIAVQRFDRPAALFVALGLTLFAAIVYAPNLGNADMAVKLSSTLHMVKDMALAAGSLAYAGLASVKMQ